MMRIENWPHLLACEIEKARSRQFAYGEFDCGLFAADCILAMTGIDRAAAVRGYANKTAALKIIANYGGMQQMISMLLESEPIHPSCAHRGDLILANVDQGEESGAESIGICDGVHSWFPAPQGITSRLTLNSNAAWRVG